MKLKRFNENIDPFEEENFDEIEIDNDHLKEYTKYHIGKLFSDVGKHHKLTGDDINQEDAVELLGIEKNLVNLLTNIVKRKG